MVVTAAIWLVFVVATLRPPLRHGAPGFVVFVLTMTLNEIPLPLLAVFVVSMSFADRPDGLPSAVAGAVLAGATVVGLIWLQVRARTARTALQVGLDHGLDPQWRGAQQGAGPAGQLPPTPRWPGILRPFQRRARAVIRVRNLSYGPDPAQRVDLYCQRKPAPGPPTVRPVLIHLHGGGFVSGSKSRESLAMLNSLAAHGWLCLSADYRLRGGGQHPNPLVDTKRLIAWVRASAAELGADPSQVFLAGCSAGGHLAVSAALTPNAAELQPGFETAQTSVAGVIVLYGYLGPRTSDPSSSPASLASQASPLVPPMLIVHGADDTVVSVSSTRAVAEAVRRISSSPVVFVELPHTQHSFDRFASARSRMAAAAAEAFLRWALLPTTDTPADAPPKR